MFLQRWWISASEGVSVHCGLPYIFKSSFSDCCGENVHPVHNSACFLSAQTFLFLDGYSICSKLLFSVCIWLCSTVSEWYFSCIICQNAMYWCSHSNMSLGFCFGAGHQSQTAVFPSQKQQVALPILHCLPPQCLSPTTHPPLPLFHCLFPLPAPMRNTVSIASSVSKALYTYNPDSPLVHRLDSSPACWMLTWAPLFVGCWCWSVCHSSFC